MPFISSRKSKIFSCVMLTQRVNRSSDGVGTLGKSNILSYASKKIDNDSGLTYTLEAILGTALIVGTALFMTGMLPYPAQKSEEHSKVQLVNIGRDAMDLMELTPITDIFNNYSRSQGVYRDYLLVANKTFVMPGENLNFTVYYLDTYDLVNETLTLEKTVLGLDQKINMTTITGYQIWNFSSPGEYNIRAVDSISNPTKWSNYVTIYVGYYYLDTDVNGIYVTGDLNVSGVVYNSSGTGIPNLAIQILRYDGTVINSSAAKTAFGRIIEDFESNTSWTSDRTLMLNNTYHTQGSSSLSLNGSPNFWIKKTNSTPYKLNYYDIVSFDFFARTGGEKIVAELSNSTTLNKFIWSNINRANTEWNEINIKLKYPDIVEGSIAAQDIDTINISVSNINTDDYFFDNLTAGDGNFSFIWPITGPGTTGTYYIQAIDESNNTSNKHRIIYSDASGSIGVILRDSVIYETDSVNITLIPADPNKKFTTVNNFNINQIFYNQYDPNKISLTNLTDTKVTLTAYTAGDYYIFYGNVGQGPGDPANAAKTNSILIRVLPLQSTCLFSECKPKCSGLDMKDLNFYLRAFIPYYVNYNLFLINPDGTLCRDCPEFKKIINGYPTDEAVTVNKIFHLRTINGEYLRELRMVLWYK